MGFKPRGRDVVIGGMPWLARMIDKARAKSNGTIDDYIYPCPIDKQLLSKLNMSAEEFSKIVRDNLTDEGVIEAIKEREKQGE